MELNFTAERLVALQQEADDYNMVNDSELSVEAFLQLVLNARADQLNHLESMSSEVTSQNVEALKDTIRQKEVIVISERKARMAAEAELAALEEQDDKEDLVGEDAEVKP